MQASFAGLLTVVVGIVLCFGGHRFFRFLMVLVGFATGFVLGGSGIAVATHGQFLDSIWGWVAAIVVGLVLGGLAWPFYSAAVAILGGFVAYLIGTGVMAFLGYGTGTLTQAAGIVAGAVIIVIVFLLRIHRLIVILVTAVAGAGAMLSGVLILLGKLNFDLNTADDPTAFVRSSPLWVLILVVLTLAGMGAQWRIRSRAPKPVPAAPVAPSAPAPPPAPSAEPVPEPPAAPPENA
jgi:hypothetical protein